MPKHMYGSKDKGSSSKKMMGNYGGMTKKKAGMKKGTGMKKRRK